MLDWVPKEIQERYGEGSYSVVSGDCLLLDPEQVDEIVEALTAFGFECTPELALVEQASGYSV
jgi:hypothetical protein